MDALWPEMVRCSKVDGFSQRLHVAQALGVIEDLP